MRLMQATLVGTTPSDEVIKALRVFDAEPAGAGQSGSSGFCRLEDLGGVLQGLGFDERESKANCVFQELEMEFKQSEKI